MEIGEFFLFNLNLLHYCTSNWLLAIMFILPLNDNLHGNRMKSLSKVWQNHSKCCEIWIWSCFQGIHFLSYFCYSLEFCRWQHESKIEVLTFPARKTFWLMEILIGQSAPKQIFHNRNRQCCSLKTKSQSVYISFWIFFSRIIWIYGKRPKRKKKVELEATFSSVFDFIQIFDRFFPLFNCNFQSFSLI